MLTRLITTGPLPPTARWLGLAALLVASLASGCARSRLDGTQGIDCGPGGQRVVVSWTALCVYTQGLPEACPEDLPYEVTDGEVFFCAGEPSPAAALLEAARVAAADGGVPPPSDDALVGRPAFDLGPPDAHFIDARPFDASP
ncbi:MAG: hypothetical protein KC613_10250 [Myxococcales bacterium]|nr:hypothetical protein [Myxococcales bacterium]MCB9524799.1 hypothetical protein [Myxococcales bacterium]